MGFPRSSEYALARSSARADSERRRPSTLPRCPPQSRCGSAHWPGVRLTLGTMPGTSISWHREAGLQDHAAGGSGDPRRCPGRCRCAGGTRASSRAASNLPEGAGRGPGADGAVQFCARAARPSLLPRPGPPPSPPADAAMRRLKIRRRCPRSARTRHQRSGRRWWGRCPEGPLPRAPSPRQRRCTPAAGSPSV